MTSRRWASFAARGSSGPRCSSRSIASTPRLSGRRRGPASVRLCGPYRRPLCRDRVVRGRALHGAMPRMLTRTSLAGDRRFEGRQYADSDAERQPDDRPRSRAAPTAAGTTSAPEARAAAVDVFGAAPLGLVVWSNGSVLGEVRSVGRAGRSWGGERLRRGAAPGTSRRLRSRLACSAGPACGPGWSSGRANGERTRSWATPREGLVRRRIEVFVLVAVRVYGEGIVDAAEWDRRFRVIASAATRPAHRPMDLLLLPRRPGGGPDRMASATTTPKTPCGGSGGTRGDPNATR
jgi:hypothetical protein